MKNLTIVVRISLGILIAFSGLNKFGGWLNAAFMNDAMQFVIELADIGGGFIIKTIGVLEILIGIALITNKFSILATLVLLPLLVSILVFHIALDLKGITIAIILFAMNIYLVLQLKDKLSNILRTA